MVVVEPSEQEVPQLSYLQALVLNTKWLQKPLWKPWAPGAISVGSSNGQAKEGRLSVQEGTCGWMLST